MRIRTALIVACLTLVLTGCSEETPNTNDAAEASPTSASSGAHASSGDFESEMEAAAKCMQDRGWDVRYDPRDGSIGSEYATDQFDLFQADYEECVMSRMPEAKAIETMTDDELADGYHKQVEYAACIESEGYAVDEPPSLEAYIDQMRAGTMTWDPFPADVSQSEYYALHEACPVDR